ncbi:MAG TPA: FtsQ-type POTRA domain-containing protein [Nitriliruptorales bacterium]
MAERRAEVRDERRRLRLRRTLTLLGLAALLGTLAMIERSSLVALQEVRVVGVQRLDALVVSDTAALPIGTSTLRLDLAAAEARIEALPLVAAADLRRIDPLTVQITVTERVPVVIAEVGRTRLLVDAEGVVLARGQAELAVIALPAGPVPSPGDRVEVLPGLASAHTIHVGLPGPLRIRVARYEVIKPDEIELVLDDGRRVRFGPAQRIDEKARALGAVLEDLGDAPVALIDVRAPNAPVVTR